MKQVNVTLTAAGASALDSNRYDNMRDLVKAMMDKGYKIVKTDADGVVLRATGKEISLNPLRTLDAFAKAIGAPKFSDNSAAGRGVRYSNGITTVNLCLEGLYIGSAGHHSNR